jgi:hypothetical protein
VYAEIKNRKHAFGSSTGYGSMLTGSRTDVAVENTKTAPSLLAIFRPTGTTPASVTETNTIVQATPNLEALRAKLAEQKKG